MFKNKKSCHIFVESFREHTKGTPYRFLSHIIQSKKICHIASWFKFYFGYFIHTIQENYIQFIKDLTISRRLVLTSFPVNMITFTYIKRMVRG